MRKFALSILTGLCICTILFLSAVPAKTQTTETASTQTEADKLFDEALKIFQTGTPEEQKSAVLKFEQAATLFNRVKNFSKEASCYNFSGRIYSSVFRDQKAAIVFYDKALKIFEELKDSNASAMVINNTGWAHLTSGDYQKALETFGRGLDIADKANNLERKSLLLYNIAYTYGAGGNKGEAEKYYKLALEAAEKTGDKAFQFQTLAALGTNYLNYGDHREAVEYLTRAEKVLGDAADLEQQYTLFNNLGRAYDALGEKQKALDYFGRALEYLKNAPDRSPEAITLNNIGLIYLSIGNLQKALENFSEANKIAQSLGDKNLQATTLSNIGYAYDVSNDLEKASEYYSQAGELVIETKNYSLVAKIMNNLANIFIKANEPKEAIAALEMGLPIAKRLQDDEITSIMLNNFAQSYVMLGEHTKASEYFLQSLNLARAHGYQTQEATVLANLMYNADDQKNSRLAVFYGKQAVNIYQNQRTDIKNFDEESRKKYLETVSSVYRKLASLLVDLGRIPEAQAILEMLKEEEYLEFVRRDEGETKKMLGKVELSPEETAAVARYEKISNEITTKAAEYEKLKRQRPANDAEQAELEKRKAELSQDLTAASQTFNLVLKQIETEFAKSKSNTDVAATIRENTGLQADLARWKMPNTVILSTIVGDENYSVILTTPSVQVVGQTPIKSAELNKMVSDFRNAVQNPCACIDVRPLGEKLFNVLLKPIQPQIAELEKQAGGKPLTLVWSLDGTLRYLPISALWDGKQYLAERFLNVEFSLASRTRLGEKPTDEWHGLGVGVTLAHGDFAALPAVKDELLNGAIRDEKTPESKGIIPGRVFLDTQFTETTFARELSSGEYPLVHIASHFAFKPGNDKQSYLLLGDGSALSLDKIRTSPDFKFNGVELLTLSACNTATGNQGADGKEFESFAVLAQQNGALSVLATLWAVADESTQNLMSEFYRERQENRLSKVESLRAAQLALLNGSLKSNQTKTRRSDLAGETKNNKADLPKFVTDEKKPFAHPYYWSPFVLIGNWR